jgi:U3 small nucleolar ribonucleoprotein protein IMP4
VPKPDTRRVVTFANEDDRIIFRHHTYDKQGKEIALKVRQGAGNLYLV